MPVVVSVSGCMHAQLTDAGVLSCKGYVHVMSRWLLLHIVVRPYISGS